MEYTCDSCGSDRLEFLSDDTENHILHYICEDCGHHVVRSYQPSQYNNQEGGDEDERLSV